MTPEQEVQQRTAEYGRRRQYIVDVWSAEFVKRPLFRPQWEIERAAEYGYNWGYAHALEHSKMAKQIEELQTALEAEQVKVKRLERIEAAARAKTQTWEKLCACVDEFEDWERTGACSERVQDDDTAMIALVAVIATELGN